MLTTAGQIAGSGKARVKVRSAVNIETVINRFRTPRTNHLRRHQADAPSQRGLVDNLHMDLPAAVAAALATISYRDLRGLSAAIGNSPNIVPGLLAWLDTAVDWEIDRRAGIFYPLLGPRAAIDDTELNTSLMTLAVLVACFRGDGRSESEPVAEFLALTASTLRAEVERPDTLQ
jgi:hypothetical protein